MEEFVAMGTVLKLMGLFFLLGCCAGCAWTGTKSVDLWGAKWENFAGMDVQAGFNNIDNVNNVRGVGAREEKGGRY